MKSIRIYLAVVLVATICIVNFIAALNGYRSSTVSAKQILEARLESMAHTILRLSFADHELSANTFSKDSIFQVWFDQRREQISENAPLGRLVEKEPGIHIVNHNGVQWRVLVLAEEDTARWVVYGERNDQYQKLIDELAVKSILPIIWVLPLIALLVWVIIGFGLAPLKMLRESLLNRGENDLGAIDATQYPHEMSHAINAVNSLFHRLEGAFSRERQFAANAAHELRTPLAVLKINLHNHLRRLDENRVDGQVNGNADTDELLASVLRMEKSIEQILALHQLTPENFKRTVGRCELKELLQSVVLDMYGALREKSLDIELVGDNLTIIADRNALQVLFTNVLGNSKKYTPEGGKIRITIKSPVNNQQVCVCIEDSGPGIPESDYDRVFDRFYRVTNDRSDQRVPGTGLGLSIAKHVLDLHGGAITLSKSTTLGGLCVAISLVQEQDGERVSVKTYAKD